MPVTYKLGAGWETVETALHDWLASETGLPVRWEDPETPAPGESSGALVEYGLLGVRGFYPRGLTPDVVLRHDGTRSPGADLERIQRQAGVLVVGVDLLTRYATGADSAFPRLSAAAAALLSPTVMRPLRRAGLGLAAKGDVRPLSGLIGVVKQGRAALELRFNVGEEVRDFTGAATGIATTSST